MNRNLVFFLCLLCLVQVYHLGFGAEYYVSRSGDDAHPGSLAEPFQTVQKAVDVMQPGDACLLRAGTYRQSATLKPTGKASQPTRIQAYEGEKVVFDGTESIQGPWSVFRDRIYRVKVTESFEQLFLGDKMLVEARWPNRTFPDELWDRSKWRPAGEKSTKGLMVDSKLAQTNIDWTGAVAVLNISAQWWTWTSRVTKHAKGQDAFEYDVASQSGIYDPTSYFRFDNDFYYLCGKLEALDSPGEWFLDEETMTLYLWMPDGSDPGGRDIRFKKRIYALEGADVRNLQIAGLDFFGCTVRLDNAHHCRMEDCHFRFPAYSRMITERFKQPKETACTFVAGSSNVITRCSVAFSNGRGLKVTGSKNTIEDNLVHDICWDGSLDHPGIDVSTSEDSSEGHNVVRHNTVFNGANALIKVRGPNNIVEYNHVHHGGYACEDASLVYCWGPDNRGTEYRYNWVHDNPAPHLALGLRGDDYVRDIRMHHNVVWNIGWFGIIVKGDDNSIYNNTCFLNGKIDILPRTNRCKRRSGMEALWLDQQNQHSRVFNNAARTIAGLSQEPDVPLPESIASHNYQGDAPLLADPERYDFRPKEGSPLIDAGKHVPGKTDGYQGKAPDIGAYEYGGEYWVPGVTWGKYRLLVP